MMTNDWMDISSGWENRSLIYHVQHDKREEKWENEELLDIHLEPRWQ